METKFQTSFIPKKPIVQENRANVGIGLFLLISIVIFLISVGIAGWVYLEKDRLINNIAEQKNTINTNRNTFKDSTVTIEEFVRLNSRIESSKELLSRHISVIPLFDFLQGSVLKSVRLNSFVFSSVGVDANGNNNIKVDVSGTAADWKSMAAQVDELSKPENKKVIQDSKISNLSLTANGSVVFSLSTSFNPDFLIYKIKN